MSCSLLNAAGDRRRQTPKQVEYSTILEDKVSPHSDGLYRAVRTFGIDFKKQSVTVGQSLLPSWTESIIIIIA